MPFDKRVASRMGAWIETTRLEVQMTLEEIQSRLAEAHVRIGYDGRFAFTVNYLAQGAECYLTHWFRPTQFSPFEDCRSIGTGTADQCLKMLDDYVSEYKRRTVNEAVAAAPGLAEPNRNNATQ